MKTILTAAMAATMMLGAAASTASAQVVLFGNGDTRTEQRADNRADRIENRGERRAERAADNGNYAKAAQIERRSENRADNIRERNDNDGTVLLQLN